MKKTLFAMAVGACACSMAPAFAANGSIAGGMTRDARLAAAWRAAVQARTVAQGCVVQAPPAPACGTGPKAPLKVVRQ